MKWWIRSDICFSTTLSPVFDKRQHGRVEARGFAFRSSRLSCLCRASLRFFFSYLPLLYTSPLLRSCSLTRGQSLPSVLANRNFGFPRFLTKSSTFRVPLLDDTRRDSTRHLMGNWLNAASKGEAYSALSEMVPRLRVAVRVVSEDEYLAHLAEGPPGPGLYRGEKKFPIIISNPQKWQIGHLAVEIKRQFKQIYGRYDHCHIKFTPIRS